MPREARGSVLETESGLVARVTIEGRKRVRLPLCSALSRDEAEERAEVLAKLARQFRRAGMAASPMVSKLLDMAAASAPSMLPGVLQTASDLLGGELVDAVEADRIPTFREVARLWTSGELHEQYPDHVKAKDSEADEARFRVLFEIDLGGSPLGNTPIDRFTLDHAERAMRKLPERARRAGTRRHYAQLISRVLGLAVYPLRLIDRNPLPKGFLPKIGKPPTFPFLHPAEDAALLACPEVPFDDRVLYGFLAREGMRAGEAAALQWKDLDLELGSVSLDENKTDDARTWALDAGVARLLRDLFNKRHPRPTDLVFPETNGGVRDVSKLAERFRGHLLRAGIDRPELHQDGVNRRKIRIHDLRGTFVTISLANGQTETWVADRTGHRSSAMVNRYRRQARSAKELGLGALRPIDQVVNSDDCPAIAPQDTQSLHTVEHEPAQKQHPWPLGGMADAGDLKSFALGHPGSSPGGATELLSFSGRNIPRNIRKQRPPYPFI